MAESRSEREALLRTEYLGQTARIKWRELQTWYASGSVISVDGELDLVDVAVQLGMDNTARFEQWIAAGSIVLMSPTRKKLLGILSVMYFASFEYSRIFPIYSAPILSSAS